MTQKQWILITAPLWIPAIVALYLAVWHKNEQIEAMQPHYQPLLEYRNECEKIGGTMLLSYQEYVCVKLERL